MDARRQPSAQQVRYITPAHARACVGTRSASCIYMHALQECLCLQSILTRIASMSLHTQAHVLLRLRAHKYLKRARVHALHMHPRIDASVYMHVQGVCVMNSPHMQPCICIKGNAHMSARGGPSVPAYVSDRVHSTCTYHKHAYAQGTRVHVCMYYACFYKYTCTCIYIYIYIYIYIHT